MNRIQRFLTRKKVFKHRWIDHTLCFHVKRDIIHGLSYNISKDYCFGYRPFDITKPSIEIDGKYLGEIVGMYFDEAYRDIKKKYDKQVKKILNEKENKYQSLWSSF